LTVAGGWGAGATLRVRLLTIPAAGIGSLAELFSQSVAVYNEVLGSV